MTDLKREQDLASSFAALALPPAAADWLLALWSVTQAFDDLADGETLTRERLDALIWDALIGLSGNEFFARHAGELLALLRVQVLKWLASDAAERAGRADVRSFGWRAGYYDVVLGVVQLVHGPQLAQRHAETVLGLYGERFDDYQKEFAPHA